ncbi:MAG: VTC domain-containing protein, partial [Bacilli bacterium]
LLPKVIVEYERLAFIHPIGDLRITFDTAIKASFHQFDFTNQKYILTPLLEPNDVVLEIKFNHELPQFIKGILESNHSIQESISKYALSRQYNYYL